VPLAIEGEANAAYRTAQLAQGAVVKPTAAPEPGARVVPGHHRYKGNDLRVRLRNERAPSWLENAEASLIHGLIRSVFGEHHFIPIHSRQEHALAVLQRQVDQRRGGKLSVGRDVSEDGPRSPIGGEGARALKGSELGRPDYSQWQSPPPASHLAPNGVLCAVHPVRLRIGTGAASGMDNQGANVS